MSANIKRLSLRKLIGYIIKAVTAIIILLTLTYIILSITSPRNVIKIFRYQNFVISSGSMEPTIKYGDIVIAKDVNIEDLKVGDVITFYVDFNLDGKDEIVTHYLASINTDENGQYFFRTHRENTSSFDSWILEEEDIIGVQVGHVKNLGRYILYLQSKVGFTILLADGIIIFLIVLILSGPDEPNKKKNIVLLEKSDKEEIE